MLTALAAILFVALCASAVTFSLLSLHGKVDQLMNGEANLRQDLDTIADDLSVIKNAASAALATAASQATLITAQQEQIGALQAQLAAGTAVTTGQLDDLFSRAEGAKAAANAIVATLTPAAAPVQPEATPVTAPPAAPPVPVDVPVTDAGSGGVGDPQPADQTEVSDPTSDPTV